MAARSLRWLLAGITALVAVMVDVCGAAAQTDIYIRGSARLIPIATPQLCLGSGESDAVRKIPQTIQKDLDLSGYFQVIDPGAYIETPGKCGSPESVVYSDWSAIGTEGLVRGVVQSSGGLIKVSMYLYDVPKQALVLGKEYQGDASQVSKMAHRFASEVMKFFTGEMGPFGTQISFSSRVGRFKELFVMDMNGDNVRQLTNERGLAVSSSWDPSGRNLIYTSYRNRIPDLFLLNVDSRQVSQITRGDALEISPHFTRDGTMIVGSRTADRDSDIVLLNLQGNLVRKLTQAAGSINVSPSFSPDNSRIAFCSNRSGGPQIYTMNSDGSGAKRISFVSSNYCTSPAWSPKGDKIAFVCQADRGFQLFVADPDGGQALQLTSDGNNEDPDWSPDGRYLVMSSTLGKGSVFSLALIRSDGVNIRQVTSSRGGDFDPAWGPFPQ